jgi:outer membrane protein TolC
MRFIELVRAVSRLWCFLILFLALALGSAPSAVAQTASRTAAVKDSIAPLVVVGERWTLARCIATALQENGDVRMSHARTRQASGSALSSWNGILPSIDIAAAQSRFWPQENAVIRGFTLSDSAGGDTTVAGYLTQSDQLTFEARAQTNLISLPAIGEVQRQSRLKRSVEHLESETRNDVVFQVKRQYFTVLKAERLAEVARETEQLARDEEARSEALFEVGTVARGDVLKARARRSNTQLDRIRAYNAYQIETERLKQVVGIPPTTAMSVEPILEAGAVVPDSAAAMKSALVNRPRLASALARESAAHSGVFSSWTVYVPRLSASYSAQKFRNTDDFGVPGFGSTESEYETTQRQGEIRLSMPLFDGLAIQGNIRQAKGVLAEAEANRRQLERDVAVEVQQAYLTLREAVERIDVAQEGLTSAEEDYNFSKSRYELGAGTFLDLLTSEVNLANARQRHVEALADARVAEADLERAVGERRY